MLHQVFNREIINKKEMHMEKMTTGQYILIKYQDNMVICKGPTNGRFTIEMTTLWSSSMGFLHFLASSKSSNLYVGSSMAKNSYYFPAC